ncbi:MAG: cyclic nucleotide-binding domain-containing protein [Deltaproteobacteria bacterium]|nr:cyclic nucleotide-binding domain-containing protein [Deltaproteobacteria bacterium]
MDSDNARRIISAYTKEQFGKLVELREINITRSSSGRVWVGNLYCVTAQGDFDVGSVGVTEEGRVTDPLTTDKLIRALTRLAPIQDSLAPVDADRASPRQPEDDFSDMGFDDDGLSLDDDNDSDGFNEIDSFFADPDHTDLRTKIIDLLSSGREQDLLEARELMPQLLGDSAGRGGVLRQMGELEVRLGNTLDGLSYLEAAAREFADQADIKALEYISDIASRVLSEEEFNDHAIKALLDQTRVRMQPLGDLKEVPTFAGLGDEEIFEITGAADLISVERGSEILIEGAAAIQAFVIKSGILSIRLETPDGGSQMVRCCFPGEFVGESSVLGEPGATCNATVVSETGTSLWRFPGKRLRALVQELPALGARIDAAREMHRLDSFFSMNRATDTLDARVRERILYSIRALRQADAGEVIEEAGQVPKAIYLLAEGRVEYRIGGTKRRVYETDDFFALSDTLHELPLEGSFVAAQPCRYFVFDPEGIKNLAHDAPPEVVAVLERLE